jgi:hypothetical protein
MINAVNLATRKLFGGAISADTQSEANLVPVLGDGLNGLKIEKFPLHRVR